MQNLEKNKNVVLAMHNSLGSVFKFVDMSMLTGETNYNSLNQKLNYAVRIKKILNLRRGIYAKLNFSHEEFANKVFTPSYISLEYVLKQHGIMQNDSNIIITSACYLSRKIDADGKTLLYHKFKSEILVNPLGVIRKNNVNIATAERAFLDLLYIEKKYDFVNLNTLNHKTINKLLPIYNSRKLSELVKNILK
jgi:hypothetical protein